MENLLKFDPHQYSIDAGWDAGSIRKTAERGVSDEDSDRLAAMYGEDSMEAEAILERWAEEVAVYPCECQCGCSEPTDPDNTDEGGNYCCEDCHVYTVDAGGDVICSRMTDGFTRCHDCGEEIRWGQIQTHSPGVANDIVGTCGCGDAWLDQDLGGWGHYSYSPEAGQ